MKKRLLIALTICILVAVLAATLVACDDSTTQSTTPKAYSVQAPPTSDIYTVSGLPAEAAAGDTVTFTVTLTAPDDSLIEEVILRPTFELDSTLEGNADGEYSFVMPASPVEIIIEAKLFEEVTSDGNFAHYAASNPSVIAKNSGTVSLLVNFTANYMTIMKNSIVVSDESVIPASAITVRKVTASTSNSIVGANVMIDTAAANAGSTWIEMHFESGNTSAEGTICVRITVQDGVIQVEKWTETVILDLSGLDGIEERQFGVTFSDRDYMTGTDAKQYQTFSPLTVDEDGKVELEIEYAAGHAYTVALGMLKDDGSGLYESTQYAFHETVTGGSSQTGFTGYMQGELTFRANGETITLKARLA